MPRCKPCVRCWACRSKNEAFSHVMSLSKNALALSAVPLAAWGAVPAVVAATSAADVGELRAGSGYLKGYLAPADLPDSLALMPAPPVEGSPALAADVAAFTALTRMQGTPRGDIAVSDAGLRFPQAASVFSCALGMPISEEATPHLNMLLRRSLTDTALATYKAKNRYVRMRPFVREKTASCTPQEEASLAKDGSYPSGHAAIGWGWALLLAELSPEHKDAILQRGLAYGQSRAICGVHWQSDIEAGRLVASTVVAQLHANPIFDAQMAAARTEIVKARSAGTPTRAACIAEAAAIERSSSFAP